MDPTRRALLGAGALLLAGCTAEAPPGPAPVDPDDALRAAAVAREGALLQAYDAALRAAPSLTARLAPVRAEHAVHLAALTGPGPSPSSSRSALPGAPGPGAPGPATSAGATGVLAGLVRAEQAAATGHAGDVAAASRPLAALLASLSASEASHPVVLT